MLLNSMQVSPCVHHAAACSAEGVTSETYPVCISGRALAFLLRLPGSRLVRGRRLRWHSVLTREAVLHAQELWAFVKLQQETDQPEVWLKEVLSEIGIQHKRGPSAKLWELKPEYKGGGGGQSAG